LRRSEFLEKEVVADLQEHGEWVAATEVQTESGEPLVEPAKHVQHEGVVGDGHA
jgi:hypothetical protein